METKLMCSKAQKLYKFSEWLKFELDSRNLAVARLAQISGVHPNTIRNYLAERCEPTLFNVRCLADALDYELAVVPRDNK